MTTSYSFTVVNILMTVLEDVFYETVLYRKRQKNVPGYDFGKS